MEILHKIKKSKLNIILIFLVLLIVLLSIVYFKDDSRYITEREFSELLKYAPDAIMCDKMSPGELRGCVLRRDETAPQIKICAAGGINKNNCAEFAATGANVLVSSAVWNQGVCDLGGKIEFI